MKLKLLLIPVAIIIIGTCFYSVFTVSEKEYVVVTRFGKPVRTIDQAGFQLKLPGFFENINRIEKRAKVFTTQPIQLLLGDKNPLILTCYVCWKISDPLLFLQSLTTTEISEQKIGDMVNSLLGSTLGDYTIENIINVNSENVKLEEIEQKILASSREKAIEKYGIQMVDVGIRRLAYPRIVAQSVYNRMRAEREKEARKYMAEGREQAANIEAQTDKEVATIIAKAEKQAEILKGQGDRQSMIIYADAYNKDVDYYEFINELESCKELMKNDCTLILSTDSDILKHLKHQDADPVK